MEHNFTNRLANETSPYLLQHAHNPVDWYAWGSEAFERAKAEDKPVLLSVGYAACHWCHVMERESFENERIARMMNENFINIKVDREERPDVDGIYMNFVQMTTGHGGWPMTVFMTPDAVPFYGGTYYPPVDRYNIPGFPRILTTIADAYENRREEILESAREILDNLGRVGTNEPGALALGTEQLDRAYLGTIKTYDAVNGGFGGAPKFPAPMSLEFLLRHHHRTGDRQALDIVTHTCRKMAHGGMYDQLGGGFHRYSVDAEWLVPHFEKMLYDNAQLAKLYLHVYQVTGDQFFKQVAVDTLVYVWREMTAPNGGFYSTQDADSEGEEGKFFVWTPAEVSMILGAEDAELFNHHYDVTEYGNFEGHSILNVHVSLEESAAQLNVDVEKLREVVERGKTLLFAIRENRVKPARDEKILTAWNGLMLGAFAEAAIILQFDEDERFSGLAVDFLRIAENNADFVLSNLLGENGLLLRSYKDETAKLNAYLEDYSFYADGLIELYQATGNARWLQSAIQLTETMKREFWDEEAGGFFFTGNSHEQLVVRQKEFLDNATPSGNSVAADVLVKLAHFTGNDEYTRLATALFRAVGGALRRYPSAFGRTLGALDLFVATPKEIAIIGDLNGEDSKQLLREVWSRYLPHKVVVVAEENDQTARELVPLLQNRTMIDGRATAYVCENFVCQQPVTSPDELRVQLTS